MIGSIGSQIGSVIGAGSILHGGIGGLFDLGSLFNPAGSIRNLSQALQQLGSNVAIGGTADNDTLVGGAENELFMGGAGNDLILGGAGRDILFGQEGADRFIFRLGDSTTVNLDVIADWDDRDRIDIKSIDAQASVSGNQGFSFIGDEDFSGRAGEVRYEVRDGNTYVYANVDNDTQAEFALKLIGAQTLIASDFLL